MSEANEKQLSHVDQQEVERRVRAFHLDPRLRLWHEQLTNIMLIAIPICVKYNFEKRSIEYVYSDAVNDLIAFTKNRIDEIIRNDYADLFPTK